MCGSAITDIWSPLERERDHLFWARSGAPAYLEPSPEILSNFRLLPLKRRFGRNVDWSRKGSWALSIELGRYCLVKGGLTMEPYLGPLLTPSSPRSFVKAAIVDESIRSSHSR